MAIEVTQAYTFNPNELVTLILAAYGAVVSTFVLGWDVCKWLYTGPKIDLTVGANRKLIGGGIQDHQTYIVVTAVNVGDQPTTITNLGGMYFDSWWTALVTRRNAKGTFIVSDPAKAQRIPYRFEIGDQWVGLVVQTEELFEWARNGYLYLVLYTANKGYGYRVRLKINSDR